MSTRTKVAQSSVGEAEQEQRRLAWASGRDEALEFREFARDGEERGKVIAYRRKDSDGLDRDDLGRDSCDGLAGRKPIVARGHGTVREHLRARHGRQGKRAQWERKGRKTRGFKPKSTPSRCDADLVRNGICAGPCGRPSPLSPSCEPV